MSFNTSRTIAPRLGTNTYSLRYALVSYLARQGMASQIIAKLTGHKCLDRIVQYTQLVAAEDILAQLAGLAWGRAGRAEPMIDANRR